MISVIIPVYNEEKNIKPLFDRLKKIEIDEIIFVNDGSKDNTLNILNEIKTEKIKILSFNKNFGKAIALSEGFKTAKGDIIVTMDGDLQDNPEEIPRFISKLKEGYALVVGWRYNRKDGLTKIIPSKIFNFFIRKLLKLNIHDSDCNFRAFKKDIIKKLNVYGGMYRYIPYLAYSKGFKVCEIKIKHNKRIHGESKYGYFRLISGFFDLITIKFLVNYGKKPMNFFGFIGGTFMFIGFLIAFYLSIERLIFNYTIGDRPLLLFAILLILFGMQIFSIGFLGEMITKDKKEEINYEIL